jgi:hypothetical protein
MDNGVLGLDFTSTLPHVMLGISSNIVSITVLEPLIIYSSLPKLTSTLGSPSEMPVFQTLLDPQTIPKTRDMQK